MALTIVVLAGPERNGPALSLDAPRLVIGRGDGCEVRLPDPSVSHRHASIRQRGVEHLIVDEGSTNGTFLGKRRLAPRTPEVLRAGDRVRVGRVWLEARVDAGTPISRPAAAKELALGLVARALEAQGEDPTPRITIVEGPAEGQSLGLTEPGRPYVIGRAKDADLIIEGAAVGRRHATVTQRGEGFVVRDLGAPGGTLLDGAPLPQADVPWRPGQRLTIGDAQLVCEHPAAEALAELALQPDEPVRPGDVQDPPGDARDDTSTDASETANDAEMTPPPSPAPLETRDALDAERPAPLDTSAVPGPQMSTWGIADAFVVLFALGVLALSIGGLLWLLKSG